MKIIEVKIVTKPKPTKKSKKPKKLKNKIKLDWLIVPAIIFISLVFLAFILLYQ